MVRCDNFLKGDIMNDQEMEIWKAEHKNQLAQYNAERAAELAFETEMFKSVIIAGQTALKSAILIKPFAL